MNGSILPLDIFVLRREISYPNYSLMVEKMAEIKCKKIKGQVTLFFAMKSALILEKAECP